LSISFNGKPQAEAKVNNDGSGLPLNYWISKPPGNGQPLRASNWEKQISRR
jgi:hypothetical protein